MNTILKIPIVYLIIASLIHFVQSCFEYSCDECSSEEYGACTKCQNTFRLIDGTCPCQDSGCAICSSGYAGLYICNQCKKGYVNNNGNCDCPIEFCERCSENGCLKCDTGYSYNPVTKKCEEERNKN